MLLQSETFIRDHNDVPSPVKSHIDWQIDRKIKFKYWHLGSDVSFLRIERFAEVLDGPYVMSIHLSEVYGQRLHILFEAMTLSGCRHLQKVSLNHCEWSGLSSVSTMGSLQELTLDWMWMNPHDHVVIAQLPKLRCLTVCNLYGWYCTDGLVHLLEAAPNLTDLNLSKVDMGNKALRAIACQAEKLQRLRLHVCYDIGSEAITALAAKCTGLTRLSILHCAIDDEGVEAFARSNPQLETVELQGRITDAAVVALVTHCGATLRSLSLQDTTFTSDAQLLAIAEHCLHLKELKLRKCKGWTTVGSNSLARSLPSWCCFTAPE